MTSNRPQITILIANLPAERDRRVIRECLSLEAAGYDVTVIAPRGNKDLKVLPGSRGTRLRPYPIVVYGSGVLSFVAEFAWSFLCIAVRLIAEILAGRAHAVQVCNPPDIYWPLALLVRALGRPWVFDHHDLSPEVYVTRSGGAPNRIVLAVLKWQERLTLRTASAVFSTNESFRDHAVRQGIPADRVTVVRNGPALAEIRRPAEDLAEPSQAPHRLVYLGVLGPQDNVEGAVLAAGELTRLRGRDDWRLIIAGDGESLPALHKLVAERGLGDVVEFAGWLDGPAVDDLLRHATVAIQPDLPTTMNDLSTMAKTVEYLGRGVPVVAADLTETRRTADAAAVYVPTGAPEEFARAVNDLFDDEARRRRMRETGLSRFTELLSWEHQARRYVAVWNRLLKRRGPRIVIPAQRTAPAGRTAENGRRPAEPAVSE
ncbi:glycosyltransferase WbuB [Actinoplanes sp. NBRC 14428]|uniref:Glycosyltransferase involved in cell wall biosynthesis n=1 Tax=Pseudosporangium ferrugineum TaxID=439699 RepID=A0A2T0SF64_9ACTN|nr:glycosyltransferase family 4 protein [Pseudosporangium ferrugineum]PRY32050.1 glycosyltransferase involved in cell wall biosynthesis [Pseudosporangium ferrugineum]BCJ49711.1 glycosyltransferase WbuB [Actinoplanes sp. NBRC 14428]